MGYRSTFVTDDKSLKLPAWFIEKWGDKIHVGADNRLPLSSKYEGKTYGMWVGLEEDLRRVVKEDADWTRWGDICIHIAFMGEDGVVSRSDIYADRIEGDHPTK